MIISLIVVIYEKWNQNKCADIGNWNFDNLNHCRDFTNNLTMGQIAIIWDRNPQIWWSSPLSFSHRRWYCHIRELVMVWPLEWDSGLPPDQIRLYRSVFEYTVEYGQRSVFWCWVTKRSSVYNEKKQWRTMWTMYDNLYLAIYCEIG